MELTSQRAIKEIISKKNITPNKILGQNFLIDKAILHKIITAANLTKDDIVLEVGPGLGTLTQELAKNSRRVIAIEKDKSMVNVLQETLLDTNNVEVIQADVLKGKYTLPEKYKLIANIPYYLTSPLIRKFLELKQKPEEIILMIQKEVAQRICSTPPNMNLLAVSVQFYAKPKIISYVSKHCFWPAPKIDSAIIKITPMQGVLPVEADLFFKIVKAGFSQPRKQLLNNFSVSLKKDKNHINDWLLKNGISPKQRAETLEIQEWIRLAKSFDL